MLKRQDKVAVQALRRDGHTSLRVARRAQILLQRAVRQPQRVQALGERGAQEAATSWRVCERYTCPRRRCGSHGWPGRRRV